MTWQLGGEDGESADIRGTATISTSWWLGSTTRSPWIQDTSPCGAGWICPLQNYQDFRVNGNALTLTRRDSSLIYIDGINPPSAGARGPHAATRDAVNEAAHAALAGSYPAFPGPVRDGVSQVRRDRPTDRPGFDPDLPQHSSRCHVEAAKVEAPSGRLATADQRIPGRRERPDGPEACREGLWRNRSRTPLRRTVRGFRPQIELRAHRKIDTSTNPDVSGANARHGADVDDRDSPSLGDRWSRPTPLFARPVDDRLPMVRRTVSRFSRSATRGGSGRDASANMVIGMPSTWRGTTLTLPRTEIEQCAPCSARSRAISAPELPNPTTRTREPRKRSPFVYWLLWMTAPMKVSSPGHRGRMERD